MDMELDTPKLPPFQFCVVGKYTYVRTYKNVWYKTKSGKMRATKTDCKRVGKINSDCGIGPITWTREFLDDHPELHNFTVLRQISNTESKKYEIIFRPVNPEAIVKPAKTIIEKSVGNTMILNNLIRKDPLLEALQETFPDKWDKLLSLAYYWALEPDATADGYTYFAQRHTLPYGENLPSSTITRLMEHIDDADVLSFTKCYLDKLTKCGMLSRERFFALDSTSISTYANLKAARYGKNKQNEDLPQLNVMMLSDEKSERPLFYQVFNGSIPDMEACESSFNMLLSLGVHSFVVVADRGFFSEKNLADIKNKGYHFLMCIPYMRATTYRKYLQEAMCAFITERHFDERYGISAYTCKERAEIEGPHKSKVKAYVHVFLSRHSAADACDNYDRKLSHIENKVHAKQELSPEEELFLDKNFQHDKDGKLILNDKGYPVVDRKVLQETMEAAGIFMVLSDSVHEASRAYLAYAGRQCVENNFRTLKTKMNFDRPNVGEKALAGKCFITFIALTLRTMMEKRLKDHINSFHDVPHHSVAKIIKELEGVRSFNFIMENRVVFDTISAVQRKCFALFGVKKPETYYDSRLALVNERKVARHPHGEDLKQTKG